MSNHSFKKDKFTQHLNMRQNKFGHTISDNTDDNDLSNSLNITKNHDGTTKANIDIFDSPILQNYLSQINEPRRTR